MSSLKTFRVEFDRPGATYAPGEQVTGNVIVDLARQESIRALKLSIKGEANVSWDNALMIKTLNLIIQTQEDFKECRKDAEVDNYRASEQYFNLTYYLLGNTTGNEEIRMPAGFHQIPFNFSLPYNIPCSFEYTNSSFENNVNSYIRYTAKAIIDRPWRFNHESEIAFTVVSPYDLNDHREQCLGVDDETIKNFCCFCFDLGSMETRIKIPKTGFVPGQSIQTMIDLHNTSSVNVTKICVELEQTLEFHAKIPHNKTHKTNKVIVKDEQIEPFGQHVNAVFQLQVPSIPPSQLEYCSIIDQKYILCITIHVSEMHFNITKTYPILIGTIPLRSIISSAPTQTVHLPQPIAPVMQYDDDSPPMPISPDYTPSNRPYPRLQPIGFGSVNQLNTSANQ